MKALLLIAALVTAQATDFHRNVERLGTGGGPISGGLVISGACSTEPTGLVCCHDSNGVRCGWVPALQGPSIYYFQCSVAEL